MPELTHDEMEMIDSITPPEVVVVKFGQRKVEQVGEERRPFGRLFAGCEVSFVQISPYLNVSVGLDTSSLVRRI